MSYKKKDFAPFFFRFSNFFQFFQIVKILCRQLKFFAECNMIKNMYYEWFIVLQFLSRKRSIWNEFEYCMYPR